MSAPLAGVQPAMGTEILTAAFVVVVIGGLGSFWGVVRRGPPGRRGARAHRVLLPARGRSLDVRAHGAGPAVPPARTDGREVREVRMSGLRVLRHPLAVLAAALVVLPFFTGALGLPICDRHRDRAVRAGRPGLQPAARLHGPALVRARRSSSGWRPMPRRCPRSTWLPASFLLPIAFAVALRGAARAWSSASSSCAGAASTSRCSRWRSPRMVFYIVYRWTSFTGGENGLGGIRRPDAAGHRPRRSDAFYS